MSAIFGLGISKASELSRTTKDKIMTTVRIFVTAGDVDRIVSVCTAEGTAMGGVERIDMTRFADIFTISTLIPV